MKILFICCAVLLQLSQQVHGAEPQLPKKSEMRRIVDKEIQEKTVKGVIAGAWSQRQAEIVSHGESMTGVPVTEDMHFRVGGVTINFLVTVLLQLVDEKMIHLDDTLSNWIPELPKSDQVTLRMLANCTSGYFDYIHSKEFIQKFNENVFRQWSPEELIALSMKESMLFEPGKDWAYSHTNFVILGRVLEKVSGKSVATLFEERIINPLGLTNTVFPTTPQIPEPVFHAFTNERGIYEDSTYWNPSWTSFSGLLVSNIHDMGKWIEAFGTGQLISEQSMQEMIAPTTVGMGNNTKDRYYAMGIGVIDGNLVQNPRFGGYQGYMTYMPDKKLSLFIISTETIDNQSDKNTSQVISEKVLKTFF